MASLSSGRFWKAEYSLRSGLWHPLNVSLPPRPPPSGGLQHGRGPVRCASLFKARFDKRLDRWPVSGLGGEVGGAANRASAMLEPPLGGGAGERHVRRMPEPGRRDPLTSAYSECAASFHIAEDFVSHEASLRISTIWLNCGLYKRTLLNGSTLSLRSFGSASSWSCARSMKSTTTRSQSSSQG